MPDIAIIATVVVIGALNAVPPGEIGQRGNRKLAFRPECIEDVSVIFVQLDNVRAGRRSCGRVTSPVS